MRLKTLLPVTAGFLVATAACLGFLAWIRAKEREELVKSLAASYAIVANVTAESASTGYFQWTALQELVRDGDAEALAEQLTDLVHRNRYASEAWIETGTPPRSRYAFHAQGAELLVDFSICDDLGENALPDRRARLRIDSEAILADSRNGGLVRLGPGPGAEDFALGLQARPRGALLHWNDVSAAAFFGFLVGLPVFLSRRRHDRFFYESAGLETIIFLFEASERFSANHSRNVAAIAYLLGTRLELPRQRLRDLYVAALLHDIGKISVPLEILLKTEPLTEDERAVVRRHPEVSARILSGFEELAHLADFARLHHERYDGSGYPEGRRGEEIPLEARIIAVADVYEALTGARPYRDPLSSEAALRQLLGEGLDPRVVAVLELCQPEFGNLRLPSWAVEYRSHEAAEKEPQRRKGRIHRAPA